MFRRVSTVPLCTALAVAARSASDASTPKKPSFRSANTGGGSSAPKGGDPNPYKSWEHMSHNWMILMCVGALGAGVMAGKYAQIDEEKLNVAKFEKDVITREMRKNFEVRPDLAPTILRVAFVLAARRAGVQAEAADESCAVIEGLKDVASVMRFSSMGSDCTTEDMVALAAIEAIKFLRGPYEEIEWRWGRQDSAKPKPRLEKKPDAKPLEAPKGLVAAPRTYTDERSPLLPFEVIFKAIDGTFTDAEIVALMGTHSVGESHDHVSGAGEYQRSPTRFELDNMYYKTLLSAERRLAKLHIGRSKENEDVRFLPEELLTATIKPSELVGARKTTKKPFKCIFATSEANALLKTQKYRSWVDKFANDEHLWATHFQAAWQKLIDSNVTGKLRPYVSPNEIKKEAKEAEKELQQ